MRGGSRLLDTQGRVDEHGAEQGRRRLRQMGGGEKDQEDMIEGGRTITIRKARVVVDTWGSGNLMIPDKAGAIAGRHIKPGPSEGGEPESHVPRDGGVELTQAGAVTARLAHDRAMVVRR